MWAGHLASGIVHEALWTTLTCVQVPTARRWSCRCSASSMATQADRHISRPKDGPGFRKFWLARGASCSDFVATNLDRIAQSTGRQKPRLRSEPSHIANVRPDCPRSLNASGIRQSARPWKLAVLCSSMFDTFVHGVRASYPTDLNDANFPNLPFAAFCGVSCLFELSCFQSYAIHPGPARTLQ